MELYSDRRKYLINILLIDLFIILLSFFVLAFLEKIYINNILYLFPFLTLFISIINIGYFHNKPRGLKISSNNIEIIWLIRKKIIPKRNIAIFNIKKINNKEYSVSIVKESSISEDYFFISNDISIII